MSDIIQKTINWHKGPALGGEGTGCEDTWMDGENLLIIARNPEFPSCDSYVSGVTVYADETGVYFFERNSEIVSDYTTDDVEWWARIDKAIMPIAKAEGGAR